MEPLLDQMNQLGPWGVVLGAALVVLMQRLGVKLPAPLSPPAPVPPKPEPAPVDPKPVPVDPPAPVVPNRPVLDGLLKVLLAILESQAKKEGRPVEAVVADALPQLVKESEVK